MSQYTVTSLEDIAEHFETLASDQIVSLRWQRRVKDKRECETKAAVWKDAANILRNTEIVAQPEDVE